MNVWDKFEKEVLEALELFIFTLLLGWEGFLVAGYRRLGSCVPRYSVHLFRKGSFIGKSHATSQNIHHLIWTSQMLLKTADESDAQKALWGEKQVMLIISQKFEGSRMK